MGPKCWSLRGEICLKEDGEEEGRKREHGQRGKATALRRRWKPVSVLAGFKELAAAAATKRTVLLCGIVRARRWRAIAVGCCCSATAVVTPARAELHESSGKREVIVECLCHGCRL